MDKNLKGKIDDAMYDFYLNADDDIINSVLRDDIDDIDSYYKKRNKINFIINAKIKQQNNNRLKELRGRFFAEYSASPERPLAILKQMLNGKPAFAMYNKLESLSKEEIGEVVKDIDLIEFFEKYDKK